MLRREFINIWWWLLVVTGKSTISIVLICIVKWLLLMVHWRVLLPRWLSISLRLLPPLFVPTLIHVFIVSSIPYNII
ncbi:hypothetical protein AHAS_Ahas02G0129000 [Arachis hypogaea]